MVLKRGYRVKFLLINVSGPNLGRNTSDVPAPCEFRDVFRCPEGKGLDGHGGLAAPGSDQAAAIAHKKIGYIV